MSFSILAAIFCDAVQYARQGTTTPLNRFSTCTPLHRKIAQSKPWRNE